MECFNFYESFLDIINDLEIGIENQFKVHSIENFFFFGNSSFNESSTDTAEWMEGFAHIKHADMTLFAKKKKKNLEINVEQCW